MDTLSPLLPSSFNYAPGENEKSQARLTVEPMMHGYGTTIGNALRRVMLSSLEGGALTAVKIAGVSHEFSTIEGVMEDSVQLMLNLKKVGVKLHSDEPVRLTLSKKGKGKVTAGDFEANADVEIVDPSHVIATISDDKVEFSLEAIAEKGRGYLPTEEREKEELEIGMMKLDAMFSPVRTVAMSVEPVRIGDITDYDKLVLDIETNGVMTPQEAVETATKILMEHFTLLGGNDKTAPEEAAE